MILECIGFKYWFIKNFFHSVCIWGKLKQTKSTNIIQFSNYFANFREHGNFNVKFYSVIADIPFGDYKK